MDGLALLLHAEHAGLKVWAEGDKLQIRGPRRAEPMVRQLIEHKPEVMAALAAGSANPDIEREAIMVEGAPSPSDSGIQSPDWRALYRDRCTAFRCHHPEGDARRLAWGTLECRWHARYGERVPAYLCAGCHAPIGDAPALDLADGCRVHDREDHACLIGWGERWRGAAMAALISLGLVAP